MKETIISKITNKKELNQDEIRETIALLNQNKKYGLVWEDHPEDVDLELKDGQFRIEELEDKRIQKSNQKRDNLLLEGDNLHSLMFLKEAGVKVEFIYIDPPYNTGSEFNYNDDRVDKNDDYRHSKWLSFMEKRLKVARDLLTDDGVIFVSIDEHEQANLELLMTSIFGEKNYLTTMSRKTKSMTGDDGNGLNIQHDSLLVSVSNADCMSLQGDKKDFKNYKNSDNDPNGDWVTGDPTAKSGSDTTYFPIENPITGKIDYPSKGRYWAFNKSTYQDYVKSGRIKFKETYKEHQRGFIFKRYKEQLTELYNPFNSLKFDDNKYMNSRGTTDLNNVLTSAAFDYPKPVSLIKDIINAHPSKDITVLDFFAGSGTTGQAVMELNEEDGGNRRFILATNNENNIAEEVTYERNKRIITGKRTEEDEEPIDNNLAYYRVFIENKDNISFKEIAELKKKNEMFKTIMKEEVRVKEINDAYGVLVKDNEESLFLLEDLIDVKTRTLITDEFNKIYAPLTVNRDKFLKDVEESKITYY